MNAEPALHATCVARYRPGGWRALMIAGPSGAGKSDLALRLIGRGWRLVGDDYVQVWASDGALYAAPAERIAGRIEVRGLGLMTEPFLPLARLALRVECTHGPVERMPEPAFWTHAGISLPTLSLDPRTPSAADVAARGLVALSPDDGLA